MFIPRVYYPHSLTLGAHLSADKLLYHYLVHVLRLQKGDAVILFNQEGGEYRAQLLNQNAKTLTLEIVEFIEVNRESPLTLHLGQGLARGDRMDFIIQKATELGVHTITPLFTQKCAVKLDARRLEGRQQHWEKIAIHACEQCGRTQPPLIYPPLKLNDWLNQAFSGHSIFLQPGKGLSLKQFSSNGAFRLAIGPESGWEKNEIALFEDHHFIAASLGPRILRTETASLTAISILQALYGDL